MAGVLGTLLLGAAAAGCVTPPVSGGPGAGTRIVVCDESGTISRDGVDTSSSRTERIPAGAPTPPGCRDA